MRFYCPATTDLYQQLMEVKINKFQEREGFGTCAFQLAASLSAFVSSKEPIVW
jgi:hypothetical protein